MNLNDDRQAATDGRQIVRFAFCHIISMDRYATDGQKRNRSGTKHDQAPALAQI